MKTVHEWETNKRMEDSLFVHSCLYSWMVFPVAGVVARVEGLRGRMAESTRQVEGLFEALLNEAFHA